MEIHVFLLMVVSFQLVGCQQYYDDDLLQTISARLNQNTVSLSHKCQSSLASLMDIEKAIPYIDASGKPGDGLFQGNIWMLGSYDECISMEDAHFCSMNDLVLNISSSMRVRSYGLCIPNTCDVIDAKSLLETIADLLNTKLGRKLIVISDYHGDFGDRKSFCRSKTKTYSTGAIVMIVISGIIGALCVCGTLIDIMQKLITCCLSMSLESDTDSSDIQHQYLVDEEYFTTTKRSMSPPLSSDMFSPKVKNELGNLSAYGVQLDGSRQHALIDVKNFKGHFILRFFKCFSIIGNTKALCNTDVTKGTITCLNGIRTISITWVIMGHYVIQIAGMASIANVLPLNEKYTSRITFQAPINGGFAVDTFFLLSGTLVAYLSMKRFNKDGKLPLLRYYIHRYIRLTPSYAYLIFFYAYLLPLLSDGPLWNLYDDQKCQKYWWTNLLYINNFYPTSIIDMCIDWGWYLANDMQFYVVSPIILWCMYKFKRRGIIAISTFLVLLHLLSNGILMSEEDAAAPLFYEKNVAFGVHSMVLNYQNYIYEKPYCRILVYFIGLTLGYILFHGYRISTQWRKISHVIGWLISVPVALALVYTPYTAMKHEWTFMENMIYGLVFRALWAVSVAWVIFACHHKLGGLVDSFLSWSIFVPLSRLTYSVYLWHNVVITVILYSLRSPLYVTDQVFTTYFVAITVYSFMVAYVVSVCIEYPTSNLEKLLLKF